LNDLDKKSF